MCVKTLCAWKIGKKPNGKDLITFTAPARAGKGEFLQLPCGQCIECRLERSRVWAIRCMHEASLSEQNCFITLTFNDYFVDPRLSLDKCDFRNFMKRLRKHLSGGVGQAKRVRYFHAGEYGEQFERPHHHAILFGFDFPDKVLRRQRDGFNYYESALLKRLWALNIGEEKALSLIEDGVNRKQEWVFQYNEEWYFSFGFTEISDVTFESCAYVARYCTKKSMALKLRSIIQSSMNRAMFINVNPNSLQCRGGPVSVLSGTKNIRILTSGRMIAYTFAVINSVLRRVTMEINLKFLIRWSIL